MQKIGTMNLRFIIRKNRVIEGRAPIQMQITIDGERIFFTTNQKIEIENWEEKMHCLPINWTIIQWRKFA